ncbi:uncharacterized protein LOC134233642 isoform X1 [Saccostrea cucullata]|uniref:uncharacterized protein LOC134233642 isoform X1 n=1 Tax=Saccostrea cuccullata TaxID=36930 RepID=UPI002ED1B3CC
MKAAIMNSAGIVYDAYTMDRWTNPDRTDLMMQQSAWKSGEPWNKLTDMGTNMRQVVSGPDGNPGGEFSGESGVRVGISGSSDPVLTSFGDLYANFEYHGNGGKMEVPLVRGSALLTHLFTNANPVIKPFCLSNFAGHHVNFNCPLERTVLDAGSGHASATCSGGTLHLRLQNTKRITDVTKIQFAARPKARWTAGDHPMTNCDARKCRLSSDGKILQIDVPNAHAGVMAFAFNYVGHYVTPWDWINHPEEVTCHSRRSEKRAGGHISLHASCDSNRNLQLDVDLGHYNIPGVDKIQYAVEPENAWGNPPPMRTCNPTLCTHTGNTVTVKLRAPAQNIKLAVNVIGYVTLPHSYWIERPYRMVCGGPDLGSTASGGSHVTPAPTLHSITTPPQHQTHSPHTIRTTASSRPLTQGSKFIMELNEPGDELPNQTRKFLLYFQSPVTPHINEVDNTIIFTPSNGGHYSGFMQLAYLGAGPRGDHSNDTVLDRYLGVYSYKPKASYCVKNDRAYASFDWNPNNQFSYQSAGTLLMITMPHHAYILKDHFAANLRSTVYTFKGFEGASWLLDMEAPRAAMEPDPAAVQAIKANNQHLQDILHAIERDTSQANLESYCSFSDSYGVGKGIGMHARLASISRAFGTHHYQSLDGKVRHCLEKWLRIDDSLPERNRFHYDTVWGGLFLRGEDGEAHFYTDYGFPFYNDHHFHLGYFLYALAYYVRHDKAWAQQHRQRIYALARDVGNPSYKDKFFPVVRHKDIYMGISWASGVGPGLRQEESSSESLNCYHALAALGDALDDPILRGTGQVMLALEIASVREYYHVRDHNFNQFPPILQKFGVVGQIAEDSFYVYTLDWGCDPNVFPMRHGCLVGIQIIPITAVSKYWMDKDWAKHILQTCDWAINPSHATDYNLANPKDLRDLTTGWKAFCYAGMAPFDESHKTAAANYLKDKYPRDLVGGTGAASTLLFIYERT